MAEDNGWRRVVFLSECEFDADGEEAICPYCRIDYSLCDCPGPNQDDLFDYKIFNGYLCARKKDFSGSNGKDNADTPPKGTDD